MILKFIWVIIEHMSKWSACIWCPIFQNLCIGVLQIRTKSDGQMPIRGGARICWPIQTIEDQSIMFFTFQTIATRICLCWIYN